MIKIGLNPNAAEFVPPRRSSQEEWARGVSSETKNDSPSRGTTAQKAEQTWRERAKTCPGSSSEAFKYIEVRAKRIEKDTKLKTDSVWVRNTQPKGAPSKSHGKMTR